MKKIYFAGTPEFAAASLRALIDSQKYEILGVFTQPDRPAGRGQKLQISAVKAVALEFNLPVLQPENLKTPFELAPADLIIVAAYGLLLPEWFLQFPRFGCVNIHASLLPRWRGAAPIQRAIEAGDLETGVGIMQMEKGLDTGAVWLEKRLAIGNDNAQQLHDRLQKLGAEALLEALPLIFAQEIQPRPQNHAAAVYAHKLTKDEARIDWTQDGATIARKIRAFNPYPVAFALLDGVNVRVHQAEFSPQKTNAAAGTILQHDKNGVQIATVNGVLTAPTLQFAGKKILTAAELKNGHDLTAKKFD